MGKLYPPPPPIRRKERGEEERERERERGREGDMEPEGSNHWGVREREEKIIGEREREGVQYTVQHPLRMQIRLLDNLHLG